MKTKICGKCKNTLPISYFSVSKSRGLQSYCKDCNSRNKKQWISENKDKVRWNQLWTKYRLRKVDYEYMLTAQHNKCAVCKIEFTEVPVVDHDHNCCPSAKSCGKCVRGLLCKRCNLIVGIVESSEDLLLPAQKYIEETCRFQMPE